MVIATRAQGRMVAKVRTKPGGDRKQGCPHRKPGEDLYMGSGCTTSTYLGKTADVAWLRCLGCVPSASMRAASLSHLRIAPFAHRILRFPLYLRF